MHGRQKDPSPARRGGHGPLAGPAAEPLPGVLDLQRKVGNRAVADLVGRRHPGAPAPLQRTVLTVDAPAETLYNQRPDTNPAVTPGTAGAATYGGTPASFDMTRTDAGARIEVKIKFVSQDRDTRRTLPDGTENPNYLGHLGTSSEIPAGDERRRWVTDTLLPSLSSNWDGKIKLVGTRTPPPTPADPVAGVPDPPAPEPVELPVSFVATAVWDPAASANETIRVFGSGVTADPATGHPIDAGNYYMNMGDYGGTAEATFAHEYGHLLGLNDEYSQSNAQMHALLHQVSPTLGGQRGQALDRATVKRMVLAAMTPPLMSRLRGASRQLGAAFRSVKVPVADRLSQALRGGASAVRDRLTEILTTAATPAVGARARHVAEFQTGENFSNRTVANAAVAASLDANALTEIVAAAYETALLDPHSQKVSVGGGPSGDIDINIAGGPARGGSGVWGALRRGQPQAADAAALADRMVGPAGRVPPVAPPGSLLARIQAIPGTWSPEWIAAMIHEPQTTTLMNSALGNAAALLTPGSVSGLPTLYVRARTLVQNAAQAAAETQVQQLLMFDVDQAISDSTSGLQTEIDTAVEQVMNTPAGAVAAAAPPDPHLTAVVAAMQQRLAAQAPAQPAGRTHSQPTLDASGAPVASQEITYSNTGMMSDNSGDIRPDQFARIAAAFNARQPELRHADESEFRAERS